MQRTTFVCYNAFSVSGERFFSSSPDFSPSPKPSGINSTDIFQSLLSDEVKVDSAVNTTDALIGSVAPSEAVLGAQNRTEKLTEAQNRTEEETMETQEETEDSEVDVRKTPGNPSLKYIFDDIQRRGASKPKESPKKKSGSLWQEKKFPPVKRRIVSFKTVTPMKKHPTHPPVEYSFASDYKDQSQVNLVLFTTAETKKVHFECDLHLQKTIEYNVANHIRMLSLFQREYSFRGVVFTSSPCIIRFCKHMNVTVIDHYLTNPYNMPLVRDLFQQAFHAFRADFYGYVNSDVIIDISIFSLLKDVQRRMDRKEFPRVVEVAGRVYDSRNYLPMDPSSKESFKKYLARCMRRTTQLRNQDSAVGACDGREA